MKKRIFVLLSGMLLSLSVGSVFAKTRVTAEALQKLVVYPEISIPAVAESMNDSKISAEVRAAIKGVPVLVGDTVQRGEMILELDSRDYVLAVMRAEAALEAINARVDLSEYQVSQARRLSAENAVTEEALRQREAELRGLKAERDIQVVALEIAKRDLEKAIIRAPFNAVIMERYAQVGELANLGTPLVRVVDASRIEVSAKVQPQDVLALEDTKQFFFKTENKNYPLMLRQLTPALDPVQRHQEARFLFKQDKALPGTPGTLYWRNPLPHLPSNLLVRRNGNLGVFTIVDGVARFVEIMEAHEGRPAPVNLPSDTLIAVDGRFTLQDGEAVELTK